MAMALIAALLMQAAQPTGRPPPSMADLPPWKSAPSAEDMASAYPAEASKANLAGSGMVECTVDDTGQLANCSVTDGNPSGAGFGAAALSLTPKFVLPLKSPSGASTVGRTVRFPVRWMNTAATQEPLISVYDDIGRSGRVTMNCRVVADKGVDNCSIIDARPQGTTLFTPAAEAAARYVVTKAKPGQRVLLVIEIKPR